MALSCVGLGLEFELELGLGLMLMMLFDLFGFADAVCHYFDLCASFVHCTKGKHIASHRTHTHKGCAHLPHVLLDKFSIGPQFPCNGTMHAMYIVSCH